LLVDIKGGSKELSPLNSTKRPQNLFELVI